MGMSDRRAGGGDSGSPTYLVEALGLEFDGNAVHGLAHRDNQAAVDHELREFGASFVAVSPMPDEELGQVTELLNGEVSRETSLSSLFANDTNAHVGCLNHRDVIAAISNAAYTLLGVFPNEFGNLGFLRGRAATGDHSGKEDSH